MSVHFEVQVTFQRSEIWAFCVATSRLDEPSEINSDNKGAVRALNKDEANCIRAKHMDADFCVLVFSKISDLVEKGIWRSVAWMEAHTTTKEQAEMAKERKYIADANNTADELWC